MPEINALIQQYEDGRTLTIFEGQRKTIPRDAFPYFIIEPTSAQNNWATNRGQRPRYEFQCTISVQNDNEDYGVEYISELTRAITAIFSDPKNLQMIVLNETYWQPNLGFLDTRIMDSLPESATYNTQKDLTIRTSEFSLFALIHEPYAESHWIIGDKSLPTPSSPLPVHPK